MRYGRARMDNAYGSESLDLPVVFQTEYYDGGWKRNTLDTCTGATIVISSTVAPDVTASTCVLEASNNSGRGCAAALTGAKANRGYLETNVTGTDSSGVAGFAGNFNLWLKATGAGSRGSVNVTATVPEWLRKDNGVVNPSATATFGIYKSPLIYRRENY